MEFFTFMVLLYSLISALLVSLIAVVVALPFFIKKEVSKKFILFLLSLSVGVLLSTVFVDFLPEAVSHGYTLGLAIAILLGFLVMFIVEKVLHHHHELKSKKRPVGHGHTYSLGPMVLTGEIIHNFIDGLVIAGSYATNITLGITATISIIFHELPQEIADFGVLVYAGYSKKRALFYNFITGITAIFGVLMGTYFSSNFGWFNEYIIPFAAGNFIYIAAANLVPELHRKCSLKESILDVVGLILGIALIIIITIYGPSHGH
jgi:zinc and cadmium transporter|tara:strand:+ start:499 stop:1284 length:786 start_codon:yes stop_codon:yes gene_type:complete